MFALPSLKNDQNNSADVILINGLLMFWLQKFSKPIQR
jgi:hypothetical protein